MLAPLGAAFGFKGAGLAGFAEILSAILSGMRLSHEIAPMSGPDFTRPREMGAFVLALRPSAFVNPKVFSAGMARYLVTLRGSPAAGGTVMAPGDREWAEAERREQDGVPVDPATLAGLAALAGKYALRLPNPLPDAP
jgi:LDH2 family malate/lactate/ureidoglycolate dehydrogenase